MTETRVQIDVVVPAYNAADTITPCLDGLLSAGFAPVDITLIDDGSTDETVARAAAKGVEAHSMGRNTSAAIARNAGARRGQAPIIFFVDADVVVAPDVRTRLERFFVEHPDHAAVFGAYDAFPAAPGRVSRIRNLLHRHVHLENAGEAVTFWTGLGAVRRADFDAVGGFDEALEMMEDIDLGMRIAGRGGQIQLWPALEGTHLKAWSLWAMARTDLFYRAIPWARLLSRPSARALPRTLNVSREGQVSVLSVAASLIGVALALWAPWAAFVAILLAMGTLTWANRRFLAQLWTHHSVRDALVAIPVLWVHYLSGGLGYAWVKIRG